MTHEDTALAFEALLPLHGVSLYLEHNDHRSIYESVLEWAEHMDPTWVSDAERVKAVTTDEVWRIQWYPNTPVGFNELAASSLSALISGLQRLKDGAAG